MKLSKKSHEQSVTKPQKPSANLQKNSTLYFQVGLILCLLATYALFEMQFATSQINFSDKIAHVEDYTIENEMHDFTIEKLVVKQTKAPTTRLIDVYIPVKELEKNTVEKDIVTDKVVDKPIVEKLPDDIKVIHITDVVDVPWVNLEEVPIYPGCEKKKGNENKKKCMSGKISKLIQRKFNTDIANDIGLNGKQRVSVEFRIDKTGNITNIKARGPRKELEKEAKRVIGKIPKMIPGKQRDKNVSVMYSIPIWVQSVD